MIIKDELIEPYSIVIDGAQFQVTKPTKIHAGTKKGTVDDVAFKYCNSLEGAIKAIMALKEGESQETLTLKQYFDKWQQLRQEIASLLQKVG